MKLVSFSVSNYRSILQASKLQIGAFTSLVGPNNEGKSNILRALVISIELLESIQTSRVYRGKVRYGTGTVEKYDWELDYPQSRQEKYPDGKSRLDLEFELSDEEIGAFRKEVGSALNGTLPIRIEFGVRTASFSITKPGRGKAKLMEKRDAIIQFLSRRIGLAYIPAVRTAAQAEEIIDRLVSRALVKAEKEEDYQNALAVIQRVQKPVLDALGEELSRTLQTFLPSVKRVYLEVSERAQAYALRKASTIEVDDGTPTALSRKGDGVQSLAALAMMRYFTQSGISDRQIILAVEEPESHLHPGAIHELRDVLKQISESNQVILTTHNPLFVNRESIGSNVLVQDSQATAAASIGEIRDMLGVRASDNLRHASVVLVVEGEEDREAVSSILKARFPELAQAISDGTLAFDSMSGGSNLTYKLSEARIALCATHCLLDNDKCGADAFEKAKAQGLTTEGDVTFTVCAGRDEAELEDLYAVSLYEAMILTKYRVALSHRDFKGKKKWSDRAGAAFAAQGKRWTESLKTQVKADLCELVKGDPANAVEPARFSIIDALAAALIAKINASKV